MTEFELVGRIQKLITDNTDQKLKQSLKTIEELKDKVLDLKDMAQKLQDKIIDLNTHHNNAINIHKDKIREKTVLIEALQEEVILLKREKASFIKSNKDVIADFIKTRNSTINQSIKAQDIPEDSEPTVMKMRRSRRPSQINETDKNTE